MNTSLLYSLGLRCPRLVYLIGSFLFVTLLINGPLGAVHAAELREPLLQTPPKDTKNQTSTQSAATAATAEIKFSATLGSSDTTKVNGGRATYAVATAQPVELKEPAPQQPVKDKNSQASPQLAAAAGKEPPVQPAGKDTTNQDSTQSLSSLGVGAIGSGPTLRSSGASKVTSGGGASYTVPIIVPPGTAGVAPKLAFVYNSQTENGPLGVGWSLEGLPALQRCPRTVAQDGFRGGINYDADDRFCLEGQRLMAVSGAYGADGTEYRTEIDTFVKVVSYGTAGSGPAHFKIWTKAGEVMEFGATNDSRIEAQGQASVRVWEVNKIQDSKGNYFTVSYIEDNASGEYRIDRIDYTGNTAGGLAPHRSVTFYYEGRPDWFRHYIGGSSFQTIVRLISVKTHVVSTLVRDYRLTYENGTATGRSRLKTITECASDGSCLPATTFSWQESSSGFSSPTVWVQHGVSYDPDQAHYADLNADGKTDLIFRTQDNKFWVSFSAGTGFAPPAQLMEHGGSYLSGQAQYADLNADGKADLIFRNEQNKFWVSLSTGTSFTTPQMWLEHGGSYDPDQAHYADLDGDGKADVIMRGLDNKFWVSFSTGSAFTSPAQLMEHGGPYLIGQAQYADLNADGKADLIFRNEQNKFWVSLSTGTSFTTPQMWLEHGGSYDPDQAHYADLNGDGKADVIMRGLDNKFWVSFSTGSAFTSPAQLMEHGGSYLSGQAQYIDVNGDGKADLIFRGTDNKFWVSLSTGTAFTTPQMWIEHGGSYDPNQAQYADLNGDSKADLIMRGFDNKFWVSLSIGPYPDLLTTITNPFGGQNLITYKPLTDDTVYAKDTGGLAAVYPNVDLQYPLYVVSNITVTDGLGNNYNSIYTYGGAKAHLLGRGALGFRWTAAVDVSANSKTTTFFKQDFPLTGVPDTVEVDRNSDGAAFRDSLHTYLTGNAYPSAPTVTFVGLSQQDVLEYEGGSTPRTIRRTVEYDSFANGNMTRTVHQGDINVSGDERDERTEWVVDTANWLHRPKRVALHDGVGTLLREKWLSYDNQAYGALGSAGLLTKEESNAGDGMGDADNPVFTYVYDSSFGVRTSVTDPRGCQTTTAYESTKTFPQTVTTCANVPSLNFPMNYVFDARFGVKLNESDWNSQQTTYHYDGFGRLIKVIGPLDGTSTSGTVSYAYPDWGIIGQQRVETFRTEQHGTADVIWRQDFFDGLGRVRWTGGEGANGSVIVTQTLYDSQGLVTAQSAPYFHPTETPKWTNFTYDILGRPTRVDHPDGTFATSAYTPGLITLTDERGKVKLKYLDAYGQLIQVDEINGSETYSTQYAYDAAGSLKIVTNHLGHLTKMDYDMLGRKRAMCDPNMGTPSNVSSCTTATTGAWVYTYNPAGDLLSQKDAKSQTLTFTYDSLGRPTTKKQGTTTLVTWTYDDPVVLYSKGRVTQVADLATTTKFAYDQLGRATQTQRQLLGIWHSMFQTYDALNRITSETFPDSEIVNYNYNEAGWLSSIPGYINDITYNARGQKTQLTYANTLSTTWTYDPNNFRISTRTTSNNQQHLTYGYDNNGNITSIADTLFTGGRTFQYDDLNRLTDASGTFGSGQSQQNCIYLYNAIGNILNKCGVSFSYNDTMHPSAVTSISSGKSYTYDANGNMLTGGNRTFVWDIDNRVASVAVSGIGTTSMEYDYTGIRVKKDAPSGITIYPFQGYEIDPNGVITKFIRIGIENFASKRGANKYFYHNDHLGGVNVVTNINGNRVQLNEYDPWGGVSRSEGTIDPTHRFTGQELDPESGLYYYGGRYYDAELGRFISPDPFVPQPDDPQSLNRYSYVLNNPVNYIDPDGYFFKKLFKKIKKFFTKYVFPVVRIVVGIVQLANGNPIGLLNIASGASSFAKGGDWQLFSRISGFIADAGSTFPIGDTGPPSSWGSSPLLGFVSFGDSEGGEGGSTIRGGGSSGILGWLFSTLGNLAGLAHAADEGEAVGRTGPVVGPRRPPGLSVPWSQYVSLPSGRVIRIPQGWEGRVSETGRGLVFQRPGATGNADSLRIMDPTRQYPQGYMRYYNSSGQPLDIYGKPGPQSATHIPLDYKRPIPGLEQIYK